MFNKLFTWSAAMGWHLWRIATVRPAFDKLSDSASVVWSFIGAFLTAGILRWVLLAPGSYREHQFFSVLVQLAVHLLVVLALCERRRRSSSLTATVLGASAVVDLAICLLYLVGVLASAGSQGWVDVTVELALSVAMAVQFARQPTAVRQSGYRRARPDK
jgi:Kef-type K+ transport system membrane component KefB